MSYWLLTIDRPYAAFSVWEIGNGPDRLVYADPPLLWMRGKSRDEVRKILKNGKFKYHFQQEDHPDEGS